MDLSLCLIVKNEAVNLAECIASVRPHVDEVVVVDTGSTDGTLEIAAAAADKLLVEPFAGDFAASRNRALDAAEGAWILFLDADERLDDSEARKLRAFAVGADDAVGGATLLRYNFFTTGGFYTTRELKAFRRTAEVRYERPINETVRPSLARARLAVLDADVVLNHFGHCQSPELRQAKAHRYLRMFEEQARSNPGDPFYVGFQALIRRTLGQMEVAMDLSRQALALDPSNPYLWLFHGHVLRAARTQEEAREAYLAGLERDPTNAALLNMVGVQEVALGRFPEALERFDAARAADPCLIHIEINKGLCAEARGDWNAAACHYETAARGNPAFLRTWPEALVERDFFRATYYETPFGFRGLRYHLADARAQAAS